MMPDSSVLRMRGVDPRRLVYHVEDCQHLVDTAALRPQCGEFPNEADSHKVQIPVCESAALPSREPSPLDEGEAQLAEPLNI